MTRRVVDLGGGRALLDIASHGRAAHRTSTPSQRLQIALTVRRVPEVMVKVSGGARSLEGVQAHLAYIGRAGELGVETDQGRRVAGKDFRRAIVFDWDLDLAAHRTQDARSIRGRRRPSKLVHNIVFSMPPGTPADKVLKAVRRLAADKFAMKHRYALTLHTDDSHPHVHLVVKAVSEQGERLNIRKATLRNWRQQFATHLRDLGVAANATERAVRGQSRTPKTSAIYRAVQRNDSSRERKQTLELVKGSASALQRHWPTPLAWQRETRRDPVGSSFRVVRRGPAAAGRTGLRLADAVLFFVAHMDPAATKEQLAEKIRNQSRAREVNPLHRTR